MCGSPTTGTNALTLYSVPKRTLRHGYSMVSPSMRPQGTTPRWSHKVPNGRSPRPGNQTSIWESSVVVAVAGLAHWVPGKVRWGRQCLRAGCASGASSTGHPALPGGGLTLVCLELCWWAHHRCTREACERATEAFLGAGTTKRRPPCNAHCLKFPESRPDVHSPSPLFKHWGLGRPALVWLAHALWCSPLPQLHHAPHSSGAGTT